MLLTSSPPRFCSRGGKPVMGAANADAQAQIDGLQAQLEILRLRAQIEELERSKATAVTPLSVPPPPVPAPVVSSQPPLPEAETCLNLNGDPRECTELVDLNELLKSSGIKPAALPSPDQLLQLDTLIPLIGGLVALTLGFRGFSKAAEWLRPDDAASARRKREERERLGITEWDQEQEDRNARDNLIGAAVIIIFELVLFNSRNAL